MDDNSTLNLLLILPVTLSAIWVVFDLFYASWLLAFVFNVFINLIIKWFVSFDAGIYIGRLKISILTGRVIFKDVHYYDRDNSIRITDGYGMLRWWKKPAATEEAVRCKTCSSQSPASANKKSSLFFLQLNGFEYHWYNRKEVYDDWGRAKIDHTESESNNDGEWIKKLRPSVHCSINKGRLLFGNQITERTLVVYFDHAEGQYVMNRASNPYDDLMHMFRFHADNIQGVLEPSTGYTGLVTDSPPLTGCTEVSGDGYDDGYLLFKTDSAECEYSLDMPGLVPLNDSSSPKYAFDVYLGSNSVINYGTYVNRQRLKLVQKFFFPNDYTVRPVDRMPQPGEKRVYTSFDLSVYLITPATLNIFFEETKVHKVNHLSLKVGGASNLCIHQPWVTKEEGYTTTITGKFSDLAVLTSMGFKPVGKAQTIEISTDLYFPRFWNVTQTWDMRLSLSKIQANFLFAYIDFFNEFIDDWVGTDPPDLLEFVPIDWKIDVDMCDYEVYLHNKKYNWVDTSPDGLENSCIAVCGKTGHLSFEFPFTEFIPQEQLINFAAHGHNITVRKYIPPSCATRDSLFQLASSCKDRFRIMEPPKDRIPQVQNKLARSMSQPIEVIQSHLLPRERTGSDCGVLGEDRDFRRTHKRRGSEPLISRTQIQRQLPSFPMERLMEDSEEELEAEDQEDQAKIPTESTSREFFPMGYRSETLYEAGWLDVVCGPSLSFEINYKSHNSDVSHLQNNTGGEVHMIPNEVQVVVDIPVALLRIFGMYVTELLNLWDNYPGEYMYFKTYSSMDTSPPDGAEEQDTPVDFTKEPDISEGPNIPEERFLEVVVDFKIGNIKGELPTHLPEGYPKDFPLISGMANNLSVHCEYKEYETILSLHLDPITFHLPSLESRDTNQTEYSLGHLVLSSIDLRCHGHTEFILQERVEYAWLAKIDLGKILGSVSGEQLLPVIDFIQTAASHILSHGDGIYKAPEAILVEPAAEPLSELLKYKLLSLTLSSVDVYIREADTLLKLQSPGFDLDLCNLHNHVQTFSISLQLCHLTITTYIKSSAHSSTFLECGCADIGTIQGDISLREPHEAVPLRQQTFMRRADNRTRRLWFLWYEGYDCGCCGGCAFHDSCINRPERNILFESQSSRYFSVNDSSMHPSHLTTSHTQATTTLTFDPAPPLAFDTLQAIHHIHDLLLMHHQLIKTPSHPQHQTSLETVNGTPFHFQAMPTISKKTELQTSDDNVSQESDSFHSAKDSFTYDEENFESLHSSPLPSEKHTRHMKKPSRSDIPFPVEDTDFSSSSAYKQKLKRTLPIQKTEFIHSYSNILDSYKCHWKSIKLIARSSNGELPVEASQDSRSGLHHLVVNSSKVGGDKGLPLFNGKHKDEQSPWIVLEVPEVTNSSLGYLPYIVAHNMEPSPSTERVGHVTLGKEERKDESALAMLSVSVNIVGSFGIILSPPFVSVIERYIECANTFFITRSAHFLLEAISLEGLGSVSSHLSHIQSRDPGPNRQTSPAIPSSENSPFVYLSIAMSPSAYGTLQFVQTSGIVVPSSSSVKLDPSRKFEKVPECQLTRSCLVNLYTTGVKCNALIYHNTCNVDLREETEPMEGGETSTNIQMMLKVAGELQLPVLQAGLFALSMCPNSDKEEAPIGISPMNSFLDFHMESPPSTNWIGKVSNVAELSMNKSIANITAKIIQSELSSNPVLMWSDVNQGIVNIDGGDGGEGGDRDSEQSHNSIAVNICVPSVRLQLGGPKHGIPTPQDLCIDMSLVFAIVEVWKPLIENIVKSAKIFWRNKIIRDRLLVLSLLTAAMEVAHRSKPNNPLLHTFSTNLRQSVVFATIHQLWCGLPLATAERTDGFPSIYQEGFLLKEIIATSLGLANRLRSQQPLSSHAPVLKRAKSRQRHREGSSTSFHTNSPVPLEANTSHHRIGEYQCEDFDYNRVSSDASFEQFILIRESMLPFFSACNIKVAPQLKKQCHNSAKLSMDYHLQLNEAGILISDGRMTARVEPTEGSVVYPEFLLEQLSITGSLQRVVESHILLRSSSYLITVRPKRTTSDSHKKHRSNVTSKCCVSLESIAVHITVPLLMVSRHVSESLNHWRKSFHNLKPQSSTQIGHGLNIVSGILPEEEGEVIEEPDFGHTHSWLTAQSLVQLLSTMEQDQHSISHTPQLSHSKQHTPISGHVNSGMNVSEYSTSPHYPISLLTQGSTSGTNHGNVHVYIEMEEVDTAVHETSGPIKRDLSYGSLGSIEQGEHIIDNNNLSQNIISSGPEPIDDTTDSPHIFSSDTETPIQSSMATYNAPGKSSSKPPLVDPTEFVPEMSPVMEMPNMNEVLAIKDNELQFSIYGSVKIKSIQISTQVETLFLMVGVRSVSGAIDYRQIRPDKSTSSTTQPITTGHTPLLYKLLPTYLSVSSTLEKCSVRLFDSAISTSDLAVLSANPLELCISLYYGRKQLAPAYRCLILLPGVDLDMKQPPIIIHKKFYKYIPTLTGVYKEVFATSVSSFDEGLFSASTPSAVNVSDLQFPPHLPRGSVLFYLKWFRMIIRPLSSLSVKYEISPVTAQVGTSTVVKFSMNIGQHSLEFTPKESKDELSLRYIPLPVVALKGSIVPRPHSRLPSISAELAMKQVIIDVTTDVFNQLLILQTSFIKEINELLNMFFNIGESIPQERLASIKLKDLKQSTESGFELISLLSSIKLSLQGIKITVSTPLQTALRFSTGNKIEMLITNPSHQPGQTEGPPTVPRDQLTLHGKVETEISVSLGYLQEDGGIEEEDDFVELAYFKTWITVRNTLQQNTALLSGGDESIDFPASLDTFVISIMSPHLYIQSTAVEKAILFWVNCKSVYNFWQNEHKQLNAEVQAATEAFVERITKPSSQIKTPSFDFSKPRLVQITVIDVGACMPLIPLPTTPHSSLKGFPALVLTIKEMQVSLNLSKRLAFAGKFSGFCVRFDEQFHFRHKTWTIDPRKHKLLNYGEVPTGTYRLCIVNQLRDDSNGEKLFSAFTWHMSGININTSTDIGRHISTLVRTLTTIGSDLDESQTHEVSPPSPPIKRSPIPLLHKRTLSYSGKSVFEEQSILRAMELDLAKQTRKLQKLRLSGAAPDSLKNEEDNFHRLELDLARGLRRVFRRGRGMTFQQWSQLLSPRSSVVQPPRELRRRFGPSSTLPRKRLVTFDETEITSESKPHPLHGKWSPHTHIRHRSDITPDVKRMMAMEEGNLPSPIESPTPLSEVYIHDSKESLEAVQEEIGEKKIEEESEKGDNKMFEPLIPSIDIEMNVTVNVDSGSITLHSEDFCSQEQRSSVLNTDSPLLSHRKNQKSKKPPSIETVLYIPAVEVKAHYQSIVGRTYSTIPTSPSKSLLTTNTPKGKNSIIAHGDEEETKMSTSFKPQENVESPQYKSELYDDSGLPIKKGVLSLSAVISSLPADLKLNPSILDFVEQVVRPINITAQERDTPSPDIDKGEDEEEMKMEEPTSVQTSESRPLSFPVEVCLTLQIHPSKVILTCNPHAHVCCEIEIPTVSFILSFSIFSRKQYEILPSVSSKNKGESSTVQPGLEYTLNSSSGAVGGGVEDIETLNNLHITGCLQTFQLTMYTPQVQSNFPKLQSAMTGDREVFSLVLGQAYIHLSRKCVYVQERPPCQSVDDYAIHEKLKVSVISHIESLKLFYDWRRLNDITWFRKCWYHTGLVEALFIGRKTKEDVSPPHPPSPYDPHQLPYWSPSTSGEESREPSGIVETSEAITAEIVLAASIADLTLSANVAQVMGNTHGLVSHLQCEAHADIQHNELVFFNVNGSMELFEIDAQGGVVAGNLKVRDTKLCINTASQDGCIPEHKGSAYIGLIEGHIDFMSAIIMLLRATQLQVKVYDLWEGINQDRNEHNGAKIQVCSSFDWSTLQIAIHRTTAKAMFGIVQRIYDFIMQQKKRSERTIGLMLPAGTAASTAFAAYQEEQIRAEKSRAAEIQNPLLEYHHWMWAVRVGSIKLMKALGIHVSSTEHDVSLGGTITVSGTNLCVVCFHGTSFRETEWAVINIDLINASFTTIAIPGLGSMFIPEDIEEGHLISKRRICQQECILNLGNKSSSFKELAAIYRVSAGRSGVPPVNPLEISDWLNYTCIDHYLHNDQTSGLKPSFLKQSQKLSIQPILCLPSFQIKLVNDHLWPSLRILEEQIMEGLNESATVECSLMSSFSGGISVTTTVENYLFLHDLFKSYIDYLDKHKVSFRPPFTSVPSPVAPSTIVINEDKTKTSDCLRRFVSVHWELDPHLFLLASAQWASGQFNPHISWVLEKLGFEHARSTIPKYIQKGLMDPLDLGIASIVELLITVSATKKVRMKDGSPIEEQSE